MLKLTHKFYVFKGLKTNLSLKETKKDSLPYTWNSFSLHQKPSISFNWVLDLKQ